MVTGYLGAFPGPGDLWLTLLLPGSTRDRRRRSDTITTLGIKKWLVSTIVGPPPTGAVEAYRVVALEGTAELVKS
jgi:hypothetical protein